MSKTNELFDQLRVLPSIALPEDATEEGFKKINQVLVLIGEINDKATSIAINATQEAAGLRVKRNVLKAKYDLAKADLLANDEDVKGGKNQSERESVADVKLKAERVDFEKADAGYRDIESLLAACDFTLSNAKMQKELAGHKLNISQREIELGMITGDSIR